MRGKFIGFCAGFQIQREHDGRTFLGFFCVLTIRIGESRVYEKEQILEGNFRNIIAGFD